MYALRNYSAGYSEKAMSTSPGSSSSTSSNEEYSLFGDSQVWGLSSAWTKSADHYPTNPSLSSEMDRLFNPARDSSRNNRLGSADSFTSGEGFDDFHANGKEVELDDLDKIMRRLDLSGFEKDPPNPRSRFQQLYGRLAAESNTDYEILTKSRLLEILREKERARGLKNKRINGTAKATVCVFCRNNGESESVYTSHALKSADGRVLCPVLRAYTCPMCMASGDAAHTIKYCPLSTGETPNIRALRTGRISTGRKRIPMPPMMGMPLP